MRKDCLTCRHEPEWMTPPRYSWLQGICEQMARPLNKRRKYCYFWDEKIEDCAGWQLAKSKRCE